MGMGLALTAFAYLWYTQLPPDGTFWRNLFVPTEHVAADRRRPRRRDRGDDREHAHKDAPRGRLARGAALTGGFDWAFWVGRTFAIVGLAVTLLILRRSDVPAVPAS